MGLAAYAEPCCLEPHCSVRFRAFSMRSHFREQEASGEADIPRHAAVYCRGAFRCNMHEKPLHRCRSGTVAQERSSAMMTVALRRAGIPRGRGPRHSLCCRSSGGRSRLELHSSSTVPFQSGTFVRYAARAMT